MRDWLLILFIGGLCAAVGWWAVRRRPEQAPAGDTAPSVGPAVDAPPINVQPGEPPQKPLAVLEFEGAPGKVMVVRPEVVIGRHSGDDVRVPDVRVSRHHARLVAMRGGGFEIHNLTSVRSEPNPMLINGEEREHAAISAGDIVTLGGVSFTFQPAA